ncbi:MAG: carboxypeptidase-like regulatory domain-containing protein [Robiginitalea sp.]
MRTFRFTILSIGFFLVMGLQAQELRSVKGSVTDGEHPMKDVLIQVQGKEAQTYTDADGKYEIEAAVGDLLEYSYTGMKDYIVRVEDVTRFLNLMMIPDVEELSEVTVTGSNRKSQQDLAIEYASNPRIIRTAFGYLNADTAPGKVRLITDEDINPIGLCILNVIRNRFAGVWTTGDCQQGGAIIIRGPGSVSRQRVAVYDVDGLILRDAPIWLDINQIKRIAVISSIAYSSRYGALGNGGVVIINTITGNPQDSKIKDLARLRNNYYKGDALDGAAVQNDLPTYLTELNQATSYEAAREVYNRYESRYRSSPYFFLDAYRHFYDRLGEESFADAVIAANFPRFEGNAVLMKALAYLYQEQGRYQKALELFKEVFILRPQYSQSYLDLAKAYRDARQFDKAARMFFRYKYLVDENFLVASEHFSKIMQHESDNLLKLHVRDVGVDIDRILTDPYVENTTRVVVAWNDTEAEFEMQFVNPEGQYHTWKHTYADNEKRLLDEKMKGYSAEEQIIDRALPGQWKVNIRYLGNKSLTPTYLKVTTYYNYGERDQQKQVRTFRLSLKDTWQELLTLNNPGASRIR